MAEWVPAQTIQDLTFAPVITFPPISRASTSVIPATVASKRSKPWENPVVIVASLILCLPVGLALVWTHSTWTNKIKWIWTGPWVAITIFAIIGSHVEKRLEESGDTTPDTAANDRPFKGGVSEEEMTRLFTILSEQVRPGMTPERIVGLMGPPHDKRHYDAPFSGGLVIDNWIYHSLFNKESYIILCFKNGVLDSGGSPGYDIKTGHFKAEDVLEGMLRKAKESE